MSVMQAADHRVASSAPLQPLSPLHTLQTAPARTAPGSVVGLLAAGAGFSVASIYYAQPMLGLLGTDLQAPPERVGLVPTLTQLGYAAGILLLAPLADRHDRRRIIVAKGAVLAMALLLASFSSTLPMLLLASLAIGVSATMAQDFVPAAAAVAPEAQRGKTVGMVMTGLLLGILLSRVVSGAVAEHAGWRVMFAAAAVTIVGISAASARWLPRFAPTTALPYGELLGSLRTLWRRHPALRRATTAQALLAMGFSAFWSTLALLLHAAPFHMGSTAAGAFGLAGVAGALAAPLAGRLADKRGPAWTTKAGSALTAVSFAGMFALPLLPVPAQLAMIAVCAIGFDLGVQATLVAHQSIVYGLDASARSRLNAVLVVGMFLGMAAGAACGGWLLSHLGWVAVVAFCVLSALAGLAARLWPGRS